MADFRQKLKHLMDDFQSSSVVDKDKNKKFQTIGMYETTEEPIKKDGLSNFGINSIQFFRKKNQPKHKSSNSIDYSSTNRSTTISQETTRNEFNSFGRSIQSNRSNRSNQNSPNRESFYSPDKFKNTDSSQLNENFKSKKEAIFKNEIKSNIDKKFKKEIEEFSKSLNSQEGRSYINKPMINFETPNLILRSKDYFAVSPTITRMRTKVTCNLNYSKDLSSIGQTSDTNRSIINSFKVNYGKGSNYFDKNKEKRDDIFDNFFSEFKNTQNGKTPANNLNKYKK